MKILSYLILGCCKGTSKSENLEYEKLRLEIQKEKILSQQSFNSDGELPLPTQCFFSSDGQSLTMFEKVREINKQIESLDNYIAKNEKILPKRLQNINKNQGKRQKNAKRV